jgi:hypothetical protein
MSTLLGRRTDRDAGKGQGGVTIDAIGSLHMEEAVLRDPQPARLAHHNPMPMRVQDHIPLDHQVAVKHRRPRLPLIDPLIAQKD